MENVGRKNDTVFDSVLNFFTRGIIPANLTDAQRNFQDLDYTTFANKVTSFMYNDQQLRDIIL